MYVRAALRLLLGNNRLCPARPGSPRRGGDGRDDLMARRKHPRNAARVSPGVMSLPGGLFLGASGRF